MLLEREKTNRYSRFLRQRYRAIIGYTGFICAIAGLVILSPLLALIFYPEEIPGLGFRPTRIDFNHSWWLVMAVSRTEKDNKSFFARRFGNCIFSLVSGDRRWYSSLYADSRA